MASGASAVFTVIQIDGNASAHTAQALDASGYPWVVSGRSAALYGNHYDGVGFDNIEMVSVGYGGNGRYPDMVSDSSGDMHVIDSHYIGGTYQALYCNNSTSSWVCTVPDGNSNQPGGFPGIDVDSSGNPGVVYSNTGGTTRHMRYSKYNGSSWSTVGETMDNNNYSGVYVHHNVLLFDATDTPHAIYAGRDPTYGSADIIKHAYNSGGGWKVERTTALADTRFLDAEMDNSGNIHVGYITYATSDLYHICYNGSTWTSPTLLDDNTLNYGVGVTLDPSGEPYIVYQDTDQDSIKLASCVGCSSCGSGAWTLRDVNSSISTSAQAYPAINIDGAGSIYVAYNGGSVYSAEEFNNLTEIPFHILPLLTAIILLSVYLVRGNRE